MWKVYYIVTEIIFKVLGMPFASRIQFLLKNKYTYKRITL